MIRYIFRVRIIAKKQLRIFWEKFHVKIHILGPPPHFFEHHKKPNGEKEWLWRMQYDFAKAFRT
jgi:hypothetical protein